MKIRNIEKNYTNAKSVLMDLVEKSFIESINKEYCFADVIEKWYYNSKSYISYETRYVVLCMALLTGYRYDMLGVYEAPSYYSFEKFLPIFENWMARKVPLKLYEGNDVKYTITTLFSPLKETISVKQNDIYGKMISDPYPWNNADIYPWDEEYHDPCEDPGWWN